MQFWERNYAPSDQEIQRFYRTQKTITVFIRLHYYPLPLSSLFYRYLEQKLVLYSVILLFITIYNLFYNNWHKYLKPLVKLDSLYQKCLMLTKLFGCI
jgi:hypothetical protein